MAPMEMASVTIALRDCPTMIALHHVISMISSFLDPSGEMTLAKACTFNSLRLLDHIWASSCVTAAERTPGWSRFNWLRSDSIYAQWQFEWAMDNAVEREHWDVIWWLITHFPDCTVAQFSLLGPLENSNFELLQVLLGRNPIKLESGKMLLGRGIDWTDMDLQYAVYCASEDIVHWLFANTLIGSVADRLSWLTMDYLRAGNIAMVDWLLDQGCPYDVRVAARSGKAHVVRWMFEGDEVEDNEAAQAMESMAGEGDLEMVQWILSQHPPSTDLVWQQRWTKALSLACEKNHLPVVQYLMEHELGQAFVREHSDAMSDAVASGHLDLAKYLHTLGFAGIDSYTMKLVAESGRLDVVQWICSQFGPSSALSDRSRGATSAATALDFAARRGHLDIVQYLHKLSVEVSRRQEGGRDDSPVDPDKSGVWATQAAMNLAAGSGHLDVVQWLHFNRSEGCSSDAMDLAAGKGYLEIVKWLHEHRIEGCTSSAMDSAASGGNLEVVKWLHEHRTEGCTSRAMNSAAYGGHLNIVKFLHQNRSEGCTSAALENAVQNGHLDVVQWLYENRSEDASAKILDIAAVSGHLDVVKWLYNNGSDTFSGRMAYAATTVGGNPEVTQWLLSRAPQCPEPDLETIKMALWKERLDFLHWMHKHFPGKIATTEVMEIAARANKFDVLLFLHSLGTERLSEDTIKSLVGASPIRHVDRWLVEHY